MYSNIKSTSLPLGLFSTLTFSGIKVVYLYLLFQPILDCSIVRGILQLQLLVRSRSLPCCKYIRRGELVSREIFIERFD